MSCKICKQNTKKIISFGRFPVSHNFKNKHQKDKKNSLGLSFCKKCNLVQLQKLFPLKDLKPKFDWINYNEPEEHLDKLVKKIIKLKNIDKNSIISGVSYKEKTTLDRFKKKGYRNIWSLNMKKDLNIKSSKFNLETIQDRIAKADIDKILQKNKKSDVLIARHILEHSYKTIQFINSLKKLVNDNGYLIFEVPDCSDGLKNRDYTTIWEEHVLYFTKNSLKKLLRDQGLKVCYFEIYKYSYENVIIVIAKVEMNKLILSKKNRNKTTNITYKSQISFTYKNLLKDRTKIRNKILNQRKKKFKICMFGTGHSACMFLNLLNIHDLIDIVIDDDRNKTGYYLPNSKLKIQNSSILNEIDKVMIILGVNSQSEKKIIEKLKKFNSKILLHSVYNKSKYSF